MDNDLNYDISYNQVLSSLLKHTYQVQYRIYILQQLGLDMGYSFQWGLIGPYSSELFQDCYIIATQKPPNDSLKLTNNAKLIILDLQYIIDNNPIQQNIKAVDWLWIISAIYYIRGEMGIDCDVIKALQNIKPKFAKPKSIYKSALELVKQLERNGYGYGNTEDL